MNQQRDFLTQAGAQALAQRIWLYWAEHGGTAPHMHIERDGLPAGSDDKGAFYSVRSDMVNGLPRERVAALRAAA
jgi:hypothetical protein